MFNHSEFSNNTPRAKPNSDIKTKMAMAAPASEVFGRLSFPSINNSHMERIIAVKRRRSCVLKTFDPPIKILAKLDGSEPTPKTVDVRIMIGKMIQSGDLKMRIVDIPITIIPMAISVLSSIR
jgi:hypothetical protein